MQIILETTTVCNVFFVVKNQQRRLFSCQPFTNSHWMKRNITSDGCFHCLKWRVGEPVTKHETAKKGTVRFDVAQCRSEFPGKSTWSALHHQRDWTYAVHSGVLCLSPLGTAKNVMVGHFYGPHLRSVQNSIFRPLGGFIDSFKCFSYLSLRRLLKCLGLYIFDWIKVCFISDTTGKILFQWETV